MAVKSIVAGCSWLVRTTRYRHDKQLVSHDIHTSNYNYKYTFSVEIAPICKDDLVCLPAKVARDAGHVGPVMLCIRVTSSLQFIDPMTLRTYYADNNTFFRQPYRPLVSSKNLIEYVVLDIEPLGPHANQWALAEAQVMPPCENSRPKFADVLRYILWLLRHMWVAIASVVYRWHCCLCARLGLHILLAAKRVVATWCRVSVEE